LKDIKLVAYCNLVGHHWHRLAWFLCSKTTIFVGHCY